MTTSIQDLVDFMRSLASTSSTPMPSATEIVPGVWVGNAREASSVGFLRANGITHVLNCAEQELDTHVSHVRKLTLNARDEPDYPIHLLIPISIDFIRGALASKGRVFVHCYAGMNRSVTVALAYATFCNPSHFKDIFIRVYAERPGMMNNIGFQLQLAKFVVTIQPK